MKVINSILLGSAALASAQDVVLVTFDGAVGTTYNWQDQNDPVMGGASTSTFVISDNTGIFNGTCAIVPFLKAPGFAKVHTDDGQGYQFPDISAQINGTLQLKVRSTTPGYTGFKVAFDAKNIPKTSVYGGGSFKAPFTLADSNDWQVVNVPFNTFSYDWSGFTGRCDTKDPGGQQHHCCSKDDNFKYCPKPEYMNMITGLEVWAEGVKGDFHLELEWLGVSAPGTPVCKTSEYCCPDAKHCLTPTLNVCNPAAKTNNCTATQACCPITEVCVDVGAACTSTCADQDSYCCPDALHCLTPVNPGHFCSGPGTQGSCAAGDVCCPLTLECVSVGAVCTPP